MLCTQQCVAACECEEGFLLGSNGCVASADCPLVESAPPTTARLLGEPDAIDVNSADVQQAAMCAVQDLNAKSNSLYQLQLTRVISGTRQVVAGTKYTMLIEVGMSTTCLNNGATPNLANCPVAADTLKQYQTVVVVQPWMTPSCSVLSTMAALPVSTQAPASTQAPPTTAAGNMVGGQTPIDVSSDTASQAALCAVMDLNAKSNSLYQMQLVRIVSGTSQIVSGVKYTMVIEVGTSTACRNNGNTLNLASCPVDSNSLTQYEVVVWLQPWRTPACTVLSSALLAPATTNAPTTAAATKALETQEPSQPESLLGGMKSINPTDPAVLNAASCAVTHLNEQSNAVYQLELVNVVSGTQQLVAGTKYTLVFNAGLSTLCLNDGTKPNSACPVAQETVAPYEAVVVVQPWKTPSCTVQSAAALETTDSNNEDTDAAAKRSSSGGDHYVLWLGVGAAAVAVVAMLALLVVRANRSGRLVRNTSMDSVSDELADPLLTEDN